jgi:hypothetical protein
MKLIINFLIFTFFLSCASGAKRLDLDTDMVSDTGGLTDQELELAAKKFSEKVAQYFKENPHPEGIFVAFYPTKNETSEQIPTEFFDDPFVSDLRKKNIFTVKVEERNKALSEIQFSNSGLTSNRLSLGKMKSPNFFVKCKINENAFTVKGEKIVEQVLNIEFTEVETQIVQLNEKYKYRKQAVRGNKGVGW